MVKLSRGAPDESRNGLLYFIKSTFLRIKFCKLSCIQNVGSIIIRVISTPKVLLLQLARFGQDVV